MNVEFDSALVRCCTRRAGSWRVPPNWTGREWMRELQGHAVASAFEAHSQYDQARGSDQAAFVVSRVMARLLTRYRQEWRFARGQVDVSPDDLIGAESGNAGTCDHLTEVVAQLPKHERWLILEMFWHDKGQTELARELGVSQPCISKKYRKVIHRLRSFLEVAA